MQCKLKCNGRPIISFVFLVSILYADSCVFEIYHEDVQLRIWDVKKNGTPSLLVYFQPVENRLHCPCMIQFQFHGYVAIFDNNGCANRADMYLNYPNGMPAFASARHSHGSVEVKELSKYEMCILNGALDCGSDIVIKDGRITWQYADSLTTEEQTKAKIVSIAPTGYDVDNTSASTAINSETSNQQQKSYNSDNSNGTTIKPLLQEINGHNERYQYTLGHVLGAAAGGAGTVVIITFVLICLHRLRKREESKAYETPTSSDENHYYNSVHIAPANE